MKIGIDARELKKGKAGKGWYVYHVLKNILAFDKANSYVLYSDKSIDFPDFGNVTKVILSNNGLLWHFAMPKKLKKDKIDLYWAPTSPIVPVLTNIPTVMTIHDLTNLLFPETHTPKGKLIEKLFLTKALKKTKRIIAISHATKEDLSKLFPFCKDKITVTPLGVDTGFKPAPKAKVDQILEKYKIKNKYILFVGTIEPRKNILGIVEAYEKISNELRSVHLVIAGKKGWKYEKIIERIDHSPRKSTINLVDYVDFADLPALYSGAEVFVFPSIYEGFGLPPLEAMACGVPVITSDTSSLPEVVGSAGALVDPNNYKEIAEALESILSNEKLQKELKEKSLAQAKKFSWEKCSQATAKIMQEIIE